MPGVAVGLPTFADVAPNSYFRYLHHFIWLLSPVVHTVEFIRRRSPFLATAIAYTAATFHPSGLSHVSPLQQHAELISRRIFDDGLKSLEIVQAYCLLM